MGREPRRCSWCGGKDFEEGWLADTGRGSRGYVRWIAGALTRGPFGGARRFGKRGHEIAATRCVSCWHLELFARPRGGGGDAGRVS
ncbi:MAG TPA: hypothetical protein VIL36_22755 [Acidimicrobiales bacterium]